jgi:hypothetical protein
MASTLATIGQSLITQLPKQYPISFISESHKFRSMPARSSCGDCMDMFYEVLARLAKFEFVLIHNPS